jgi:ketosteroid isomerase-like protein
MKSLACLSLFAAAFTGSILAQSRTSPVLDKLEAEFVTAFNAKDAAKLASFYAEDGVLMPPGGPTIKGRAAIEAVFKKGFEANPGTMKLAAIESEIDAGRGYSLGTYTLTVSHGTSVTPTRVGGSGTQVSNHKFMAIYKRVGNDWKVAYGIQNSDR